MLITTSTIIDALKKFNKDIPLPQSAIISLQESYEKLCKDTDFLNIVRDHLDGRLNSENIGTKIKTVAEKTGVCEYTVAFCTLISFTPFLKKAYKEKGISDEIYLDTMRDLYYKLDECIKVKGVCGTFVANWLYKYFQFGRFTLGRLQVEVVPFGESYKDFTPETKMLKIHIPASKQPLTQESIRDSLIRAKTFFGDSFPASNMVICSSWLLYPGFEGLFKEGSNIAKFRSMFEIVKVQDAPDGTHPDMWRLFDMDYTGNADDYPENSSLHRSFKEYIKGGGVSGTALGIFNCGQYI